MNGSTFPITDGVGKTIEGYGGIKTIKKADGLIDRDDALIGGFQEG